MTESRNFDYEIPWKWHNEQLKENIRKNKHHERIRNNLQKKRTYKSTR